MRPTASAVAQNLLNSVMIEASKALLVYKLEDPSITNKETNWDVNSIFQKVKLRIKERKKVRQALKKQQLVSILNI
jgi:hypothetical protein